MSWFSRSVSEFLQGSKDLLESSDEKGGEVEEEEELVSEDEDVLNPSLGKGVKEDLSELTKSLTKQIWGVASFLAPPPAPKGEGPQKDDGFSPVVPEKIQSSPESAPIDAETSLEVDSANHQMSEIFLEDANLDSHSSEKLNPSDQSVSQSVTSPQFTGMRSDWAELKGGIAKGLSRISSVMRVVAGEERREPVALSLETPSDSDDRFTDKSNISGFSSIFRPLLANLHLDKSSGPSEENFRKGNDATQDNSVALEMGESFISTPTSRKSTFGFPSNLVSHIDGISKLASSFLPFDLESDKEKSEESLEAVGVTDDIVSFADNIAMHPETWLDFPHFASEDDDADFEMTRLQQQHVQGIEYASPRLTALKSELCPHYMLEERFWKIYFVLLHSRLKEENRLLSSTPQVLEARSRLLQELKSEGSSMTDALGLDERNKSNDKINVATHEDIQVETHISRNDNEGLLYGSMQNQSPQAAISKKVDGDIVMNNGCDNACHDLLDAEVSLPKDDSRLPGIQKTGSNEDQDDGLYLNRLPMVQKTSLELESAQFAEKQPPITNIGCTSTVKLPSSADEDEVEADEWLDEEQSNADATVGSTCAVIPRDDEDVSFSDLEDEDVATSHMAGSSADIVARRSEHSAPGITKGSEVDAVHQLPERAESNDWLTVDEEDIASTGSS